MAEEQNVGVHGRHDVVQPTGGGGWGGRGFGI